MKLRVAAVLCTSLALALPAGALAALPKASDSLIVPNHSIGGVLLGAKASQVTKAWGSTSCELQCVYEGAKRGNRTPSTASVLLEQKGSGPAKVWLISINVGFKPVGSESVPDFDTPLTAFQTSKGIGLGSKISEVQRAYPTAKKEPVPGGSPYFKIAGPKEVSTTFSTADGRVTSIYVESHPGG
jgi:hypothetical protein